MGHMRKGLRKQCSHGASIAAPRESHLPATDQKIGGTRGAEGRGRDTDWTPAGGRRRRGRWQRGILAGGTT